VSDDDEGEESGGEEGEGHGKQEQEEREGRGRGSGKPGTDKVSTPPQSAATPVPAGPVRASVGAGGEGRSTKREEWYASQGVQGRVSRDHVWLLGPLVDPPSLHSPSALQTAGGSWPMHICVQSALEAYKSGSSVRSLAVDPGETLLLSGSRRGVVNVWSLRDFPVAQQLSGMEHLHTESVFSLAFMNGGEQALSLDSSLCVWDVATGAVLARKERYAPEIGGMPFCYMAAEALPAWGGVGLSSSSGGDYRPGHHLLAATQTTLYHYDLRDRVSASSAFFSSSSSSTATGASQTMLVAAQLSEWGVSSSCFTDRGIGAALQCLATHEDGYWVCTGSSNGQLCVLDRRTGEIAQAWQAHEGPIIKVFPWSRDKVLSVSMDRTAVLWDIRSTIPRDICCLRGLPDAQSATTVIAKEFRRTPSASSFSSSSADAASASASGFAMAPPGKRPHVLLSFGGHKGVIAKMPRPGMDVAARTRYFLGPNGLKLRQKINVQSAALLPLRNLLLVGCDDGLIRVCT
jgi:WD40 repeat protein